MQKEDYNQLKEENEILKKELNHYKEGISKRRRIIGEIAKWGLYSFIGKDLKSSVRGAFSELENGKKISAVTRSDLITNVFLRFTRIGCFTIFIALLPSIILLVQTCQIGKQNKLITNQNERLRQQTYLQEASRRSASIFLFSKLLDDIDKELTLPGNDTIRTLSPQTIGRITALSLSFKPYRYLHQDSLIERPISPERGQLLVFLSKSRLNIKTMDSIFFKTTFEYADLRKVSLGKAYLRHANLREADFRGADIRKADLTGANLIDADFSRLVNYRGKDKIMFYTQLQQVIFDNAVIRRTNLSHAALKDASFSEAYIDSAIFKNVYDLNCDQLTSVSILRNPLNLNDEISSCIMQRNQELIEPNK